MKKLKSRSRSRRGRRLRTKPAAAYCGSTASTFAKMRVSGAGPKFIRVGGVIVYDTRHLDAWLDERTFRSTSEADTARVEASA